MLNDLNQFCLVRKPSRNGPKTKYANLTRDNTDLTEAELEFADTGSDNLESRESGKPQSGRQGRMFTKGQGRMDGYEREDTMNSSSAGSRKPKSSLRRFNFSMDNRMPQVDLANVRPVTRGSLSSPRSFRERHVANIMGITLSEVMGCCYLRS